MKTLLYYFLFVFLYFVNENIIYSKSNITAYYVPNNGSTEILIEDGNLYRVTIESCWSSADSRMGTYLIYGLNVADSKTGGKPKILTLSETGSTDWSLGFSQIGDYDANMTISSNGWGDQGLKVVVENLPDYYEVSTEIKSSNINSSNFTLDQNYPNPFNPTTIISYQVPERSQVSLKVYDILGRELNVLEDKIKNTGSYKILFNANNFTSGIYFYKLDAQSKVSNKHFTKVGKMILLK